VTPYNLLRCLGILVLGLLIYGQTFHFDFVFDDYIFIVTNPFIKNFSNIHLMWHVFPVTRLVGMYSFAINYHFNQLHAAGYHIFNFMVHLAAVALVWALADLLFKMTRGLPSHSKTPQELPFIMAVLFLVHPCQSQAVTYITQRFESMATVFYLAGIYFYLRGRLSSRKIHQMVFFSLVGLSTIVGLMTKEVVVTLPLMILIGEWILFPKKNNHKAIFVFLVIGLFLYLLFSRMVHANLSIFIKSIPSESHDGDVLTPGRYFLTQMRVFLTFLRLFIFPFHQNLDYDYPVSTGFFSPILTFVGGVVMMGTGYLVFQLRQKYPLISFGLAWVLVTFSINLAPRSNVIFEHKMYLLSFGFLLSAVAVLSLWITDRRTLLKVLSCGIIILSFITYQRNKVWSNEISLWEDVIKNSPNKARVNSNLARVYGQQGRYDESIKYFSRAIALKPDNISYENRGVIYSEQGKNDEALEDLDKSIAMDPTYFSTYIKRSWVYQSMHNYQAALLDLQEAIRLEPYFEDAYIERGILWVQMGKAKEALQDFDKALKIDPLNFDILLRRGAVYYNLQEYSLALEDFLRADSLEPNNSQVKEYKAACLEGLRK